MRPGLLQYRVEIQTQTSTSDAMGQPVNTWKTTQTRWAGVMPLTSREGFFAKSVRPELSHRITLRWFDGLEHGHRIKMDARIFDIASIINVDEGNHTLQVDCVEVVS
jgi:SPP1 family predicted phage head-tail adaptor